MFKNYIFYIFFNVSSFDCVLLCGSELKLHENIITKYNSLKND